MVVDARGDVRVFGSSGEEDMVCRQFLCDDLVMNWAVSALGEHHASLACMCRKEGL
jgi:hypothetical protein